MALHDFSAGVVFTPASVPMLAGWWDATDASTITESAGAVSQWNDKSGNAYHVTQSTASAKPTTGTRTINGRNTLDFDGGDTLRKASGVRGDPAFALYAVVEPDTVAAGTRLVLHSGVTGVSDWSFYIGTATPTFFGGSGSLTGGTASAATPILLSARLSGPINLGYVRAGGTEGAVAAPGVAAFTAIDIGNTDTGSNFFDGKIGEIIWYSGTVSIADDILVRNYLAAKWNVTA